MTDQITLDTSFTKWGIDHISFWNGLASATRGEASGVDEGVGGAFGGAGWARGMAELWTFGRY